ncbi:hypothetical protein CSV79_08825 [Sporosarcina sp. P13]|uniref:CAP and S-layer homology domain-containing protein n=1 Tax=Sporosarcina sp. P13 TaxID=2048263 RepID=UPI000C16CA23|nr:S-layer homology domain-containing protein [Sporosarcina sp. P13]PIC64013.1 hypothetical protein CSV79_08825 [Sporosarcina sp. P13]
MKLTHAKKLFISTTAIAIAATTTFAPAQAVQAKTFKDVPANHYAHEAITYMAANKIINGYSDNTYGLNQPVTRAQAAKMIALAIGAKSSNAYRMNFTDVTKENGAYEYIRALTEKGLFINQSKFNPNEPLTRGQMAKLLVLGYNIITDNNDTIRFADVAKSNGSYAYIITIAELNITTTRPDSNFNPNSPVTRAQMAAFLYRAIEFDNKRKEGRIVYDKNKKAYVDQKPVNPPTPEPSLAAQTLITTNVKRKAANISLLKADPALNRIARAKAEDMAKNGKISHTSPTYGTTEGLLKTFDYKYKEYGENIGAGFDDAQEIVNAWLAQSGEYKNILNPVFTHMGAGTATDKNGVIYWVGLYSQK